MTDIGISVAAAEFGRDMEQAYRTIGELIQQARTAGSSLLVLPEACLGGYLPAWAEATKPRSSGSVGSAASRPHWNWTGPRSGGSSTWPATW